MIRARLLLFAALVPALAFAQSPPDSPAFEDFPDASVGEGGADLKSPEAQDSLSATTCTFSSDCEHGFVCVRGACVYQRTRDATFEGCGASAVPGGLAPLAGLALWRRAKRRRG